jgi:cytochrome c oxidase assembly protein subunit 11
VAPSNRPDRRRHNGATVLLLVSVVAGMVGLSFASVPLYQLFCAATGFGGTTQRAETAPNRITAGLVTVSFNADVAPGLDWEFHPLRDEIAVHPGEQAQVYFRAVNRTAAPVTARAVYNVTPAKVGIYFDKLQCFCFSDQTLAPGQSVDMGVEFFVDPDLLTDPNTSEVRSITLSYTMFPAARQESPKAQAGSTWLVPARSLN